MMKNGTTKVCSKILDLAMERKSEANYPTHLLKNFILFCNEVLHWKV